MMRRPKGFDYIVAWSHATITDDVRAWLSEQAIQWWSELNRISPFTAIVSDLDKDDKPIFKIYKLEVDTDPGNAYGIKAGKYLGRARPEIRFKTKKDAMLFKLMYG